MKNQKSPIILRFFPSLAILYDNGNIAFDQHSPYTVCMVRFCILLFCCLILGCGSSRPYDVHAAVTLDDHPLPEANVTLVSVWKNKPAATGITDAEGHVTFKTGELDGVLPGTYVAVLSKIIEEKTLSNNEIRAFAEAGIRYVPKMIETVPQKYTKRETSDLKINVGYWHSPDRTLHLFSEKR